MNIEIANRLVQLRKQHGYSQEELAAKLGLSRQAVSKWERAEASPDTDNLIMLSRVYGVSLDELLKTDEPIPEPESDKGVKVTINGKPLRFNKDDGFFFSYGDEDDGSESDNVDANAHVSARGNLVIEPNEKSVWQEFPFPIFVTILYLGLGFAFGLWHPGWILFLTIPAYLFNSRLVLRPPQALLPARLSIYPIGRHSLPLHGLHMGPLAPGLDTVFDHTHILCHGKAHRPRIQAQARHKRHRDRT